ncbi:DNA-directed RNA polymerase subunit beta, partial [Candidatus Parcubacteria bacterium]|nr:DNA-directed RNA polymerase subunit beta [Candidatus Parcubacteria bacterium]
MPQAKTTTRKYFTTLREAIPLTDLIEVQKKSYDWFFKDGLKELFDEISPIKDFIGRDLELYFTDYYLDEPKFDEVTAKDKNVTFEAPLRVNVRLTNKRTNEVKEQEIYLGDFPLMTERGTFIINGVERVVVSQLIRSAGVFFTSAITKGRKYYGAKIIPNRGAWLEIETDGNNIIYVKIDRKRKVPITALFRAFGYSSDEEIINLFKEVDNHPEVSFIQSTLDKDTSKNDAEGLKEVYKRIRPGDLATTENARSLIHSMFFDFDRYDFGRVGRYKINSRFDLNLPNNKETRVLRREDLILVISEIIRLNLTQEDADDIDHLGNRRVRAIGELVQNRFRIGLARMERIIKDRMSTLDIAALNPNQLINARPVIGVIKEFFMSSQLSQFMDQVNPLAELEHKRRLSAMGPGGLSRERAGFEVRDVHRTHYGRICPIATPEGPNIGLVGHLAAYAKVNDFGFIETPFRRVYHDVDNNPKMTTDRQARQDIKDAKGKTILKAGDKITAAKAKELAGHKDIEIVAIKPVVTDEIVYMDAFEEERYNTAAATTPIDDEGYFVNDYAEIRIKGNPTYEKVHHIDLLDVAPNQIISIATSMIPFLEHDDAVRALMGTNMQRQAVSVIRPQAPIVGTGIEAKAAMDSGQVVLAKEAGEVTRVDSRRIDLTDKNGVVATYNLNKFARSNTSTSMNQHPIVDKGQKVKKGEVLADGAATDQGELALGQNMLVAYMTWDGGNYEDAILISERVVKNDNYTSVSIE